jgi:hypothetical protein
MHVTHVKRKNLFIGKNYTKKNRSFISEKNAYGWILSLFMHSMLQKRHLKN